LEQRAILGEVTSVFAHEVRNPINNISTGLQLMAMNLPAKDPNVEVCKRLQQDCDRLAELMKSVLAFARPIEPKMEPVDLGQLIRRLLERWHPQMARANIQHHLQIDSATPPMLGDVRPLEQVFTNLINNAMQVLSDSNQGGTLTLKVRPIKPWGEHEQVEVSVIDNGPGIPDDVRERIFEPFFTTRRGGTGLGLAITKRIVTAHKGTIQVTSIPGATVFQIRFPAAKHTTLTPAEVP
jgi:signal transduction histidine kinase